MNAIDLNDLVAKIAARDPARAEAELQGLIQSLLLFGGLNLEDAEVRLETPAPGRRRIDIEVGLAVIECKRDLSAGGVRDEAVEQLAGYVRDRTRLLRQRYVGILTDGREWTLFYLRSDMALHEISTFTLLPGSGPEGLLVWLESVLSTGEQLQPTPTEIRRRLGADGPSFALDCDELADLYEQCRGDSEIELKRELWARLLAATFGRSFKDEDRLFIEHTYLVLTAEVIAHAVMGFDLLTIDPADLASGKLFRAAGIGGVVDADFFDWPCERESGLRFVSGLARRLARFDWSNVDHDVLKILYESVIDRPTRHSLGEYYTPDWLAQPIVEEAIDDPLNQRVLDPSCGSGTFVFWAARRYLEAAEQAGIPNREAVTGLTAHVFGIDLHPVAVTLARVTYLLAIGADRLQDRDQFSVPVYLGDSIQFNQNTSVLSGGGITVYTSDGMELFAQELSFPESVVADPGNFDSLIDALATRATRRNANGERLAIGQVMTNHGLKVDADREVVQRSYDVLCHLHEMRRDHIWGYYVRNLARPLEFTRAEHRVDRLVGNPPWLRYNAMTPDMQADFRRLNRERGLQAAPHLVTSQDLAGLFVARSTELYLAPNGRFAFVMPASTLTRAQYRGFRTGAWANKDAATYAAFDTPWELSEVDPDPCPVPAAVIFGRRVDVDSIARLPESAQWWSGHFSSSSRSWAEVKPSITRKTRALTVPDGKFASPYAGHVRQGSNLVPRVLATVAEETKTALLGLPADQAAIRSDRSSPEKPEWKALQDVSGVVERQFIRPFVLGESVLPYATRGERFAVIPWDSGTKQLLTADSDQLDAYPKLSEWWSKVDALFKKHRPASTKLDLLGQFDYQGKLRAQLPARENRVIYAGRGSRVTAARLTDATAIVDHALYWAAFGSPEEALYVCAVINSYALHSRIEAAMSKGLLGVRNIHRAPFMVPWPLYDPGDDLHTQLAADALAAENFVAQTDHAGATGPVRTRIRRALEADGIGLRIEQHVEGLLATALADQQLDIAATA